MINIRDDQAIQVFCKILSIIKKLTLILKEKSCSEYGGRRGE
jgi:hypothetical protein